MIRRVVTDDAVIVEITSIPLARTHNYKRGDYIACRRKKTPLGEVWEAVEEQRISVEEVAEKEEKSTQIKKQKPAKKTPNKTKATAKKKVKKSCR